MFFYICRFLCWLPLAIFYPIRVIGRKHLIKGKAVMTPNHTSSMDIVLLLANTHEKKYILAKKELFKNKFKGAVLKSYGGISVDRGNNDIGAIKKALKVLKDNKKLIIFPEGTRNKNEDTSNLQEVKTGTAMIAIKSKSPIIPVWISRRPKMFRMTKIIIGKPYELTQFYDKKISNEVLEEASKIITKKIEELK